MNVARVDVAIMGGNSINCSCVGDLGVRIEGGHNATTFEVADVDCPEGGRTFGFADVDVEVCDDIMV